MPTESPTPGVQDILAELWRRRGFILTVTLVAVVGAAVGAYFTPRRYEARVVLSPVSDEKSASQLSSVGAALSQIGGFASLAGLVGSGGTMRAEAVATLQSDTLTQDFIAENGLLPVLFEDQWDSEKHSWRSTFLSSTPTLWKGKELFRKRVRTVVEDKRTGLVELAITWTDPTIAARWANDLVRTANDYLRTKAITESERSLAYLNEQVSKTSVVELQKAIYALMESEIRKQMLARGTDEYALKVVDKAIAPERASSPRTVLLLATGFIAGLLLSSVYVLARRALRQAS